MMNIYNPASEGTEFKCDQCKKFYKIGNGKDQEITDRLELENFTGNQRGEYTLCKDCWKKRDDRGFNEPTSIQV